jgi:hypothetical protein
VWLIPKQDACTLRSYEMQFNSKRNAEIACCLTCKFISCRVRYSMTIIFLTYILRSCLSSPTFSQQGLEYYTVDPSLTKITSLLQVTRSGFYCPGSRNSLSWGASGLDTGAWCRLHLWRHRVASPRDVKGRYPAAHNHHVHRTSELPAWTSDHRHHFKVGISIL